ncbi:MAG: cell wall-binding repeat-containing protein [Desulfosporosinus sp.]|nr:cell wall-binding repeat-containing protein [Desulfosporosinus sp.]
MRNKLMCLVLATILVILGTVVPASAETVNGADTTSRLAGQDHYQTSMAIAGAYNNNGECGNVILASGNSFPDALSASLFSKKYSAPILLVGTTVNASSDVFNYLNTHATQQKGTVYIVGGTGVIGSDFETKLTSMGYSNIKRLGGTDRYDTNMLIVNDVNVPQGTPVFIASGENFPDALSISSISGSKQYPTLLAGVNYLPEETKSYLLSEKPSAVYIAGGISVVSQDLENRIKALAPNAALTRLAGDDRFETNAAVLNKFSSTPAIIYLANGDDFQDVLAGSALAAKTGDPIILVDNQLSSLPPAVEDYLKKLSGSGLRPNVIVLGGTEVVSDILFQQFKNNFSSSTSLSGISIASSGGIAFYLDSIGSVWAWGGGSAFGNGTDDYYNFSSETPVQVHLPVGRVITAIAGGGGTGYALDSTSQVWAWGDGLYGELGNGKANSSSTPVQVSISAGKTITAIAGGGQNGYALDSTGHVWAWGYAEKGGLRSGNTFNLVTPVQVYMPPGATKLIAIAGGDENGYALDSSGHVWTWGYGRYGEFGNGTTDFSNTTVQVPIPTDTIIAIAGGQVDGYALDSTGHVWAWGAGGLGELGNGTTTNFSTPVQVSIPSDTNITAITSGGVDGYALDSTGHVWAWGYGYGGKFENGIYNGSTTPVEVPIPSGTPITAIASGLKNGYALDSTGHVWAWGNGIYERLGNNMYISNTPVQILNLPPVKTDSNLEP